MSITVWWQEQGVSTRLALIRIPVWLPFVPLLPVLWFLWNWQRFARRLDLQPA